MSEQEKITMLANAIKSAADKIATWQISGPLQHQFISDEDERDVERLMLALESAVDETGVQWESAAEHRVEPTNAGGPLSEANPGKSAAWVCDECNSINLVQSDRCDCGEPRPSCIRFI